MNDCERAAAFRAAAKRAELSLDQRPNSTSIFVFDLSQGRIITPSEPEKVMELVQLARDYAKRDQYGEHNSLLALVAPRDEVDYTSPCHWSKLRYVNYNPKTWITLKEWLEQHGQNPDSIFSDSQ